MQLAGTKFEMRLGPLVLRVDFALEEIPEDDGGATPPRVG